MNIFGGMIAGTGFASGGLDVIGGVANIFGGTLSSVNGNAIGLFNEDATVNLHGGDIVGTVSFGDATVLNVFGTDFLLDGNPIGAGTVTGGGNNAGALSVTFADGTQTAFDFEGATSDQNQLNLILVDAIPEPSTAILLLTGIGSLACGMRRRSETR